MDMNYFAIPNKSSGIIRCSLTVLKPWRFMERLVLCFRDKS